MFDGIDFFSDTITKPSVSMKQAMMNALVGDEQKGEDPTTERLEERVSSLLGKSSALFFPSATMCNQVAVALHCQAGDEVIGAEASHIFTSEGGGAAAHARAQARAIPGDDGTFDGDQVKRYVRFGTSPHTPKSSLVIVENTMNGGGGTVWPMAKQADVVATARQLGLKCHLDGARIFNAAVARNCEVRALTEGFDSVTVCFSKGLGCPMGAVLAFDAKDWPRVRRLKQMFGGALRQSGIIAAACLYALDNHIEQLAVDHENARRLGVLLNSIDGVEVENSLPDSNMVYFTVNQRLMDAEQFVEGCLRRGLRFSRMGSHRFRAVTHRDVQADQIEKAGSIVEDVFKRLL